MILARSRGVDVTTGWGLNAALAGAAAVIDVSNVVTTSRRRSVAFFPAATEHLLAAAQQMDLVHYVALPSVGIDRVDFGYYEGKRVQEELVLSGPVLARVRGPVALVPRMRSQSVAAREVAAALVALATSSAVGRAPELGRAMATGALLPAGPGPRARQSFASWLTETGSQAGTDAAHTDRR